ncbi:PREDICTED: G-type lectin S-receptor [Prunus dulcis]|uniref:PREDICTED: G-type lectin S-receptor n=1 Tax=Prunus dulcis TaxID=3755 RepID=A0A5E4G372_PRUDU|nr:PREDICTED: G-type lectin S-receptor [Prunus dulcis]
MKLVRNKITGFNWHLTPWKSPQDPSQGHYPYQLGPYGYHELILREGSVIKYRTAPWNGIQFSGMHNLNPTYDFVLDNDDEVYYGYKLLNSSTLFRLALTQDGFGPSYIRSDGNQGWVVYLRATTDICDKYGICGPNCACCIDKSPLCSCLKGFIPTFKKTGSCWIGHIDVSRTQYKDHSNQYCVVYWTADPGTYPAIICVEEPATKIWRTEARPKGRSGIAII